MSVGVELGVVVRGRQVVCDKNRSRRAQCFGLDPHFPEFSAVFHQPSDGEPRFLSVLDGGQLIHLHLKA